MRRTAFHRPWSEEESQKLRDFVEKGGSVVTASVRFKRSESSLREQAKALGIRFETTKERRQRLLGTTHAT